MPRSLRRRTKRSRDDSTSTKVIEDEEDRYFLNPDSVSRHLFCSVCQEVFKDPQRAPCGHSFCRMCILRWLKQSKTCPEDRRPVRVQDLHTDFIVANIIGDQMVACSFRGKGCEFIGKLELLKCHTKNCDFNPANLPEFLANDDNHQIQPSRDKSFSESVLSPINAPTCSSDPDKLPTPAKPSLKMRLFRNGGDTREKLCAMFDNGKSENKENNEDDVICLD
ncbi:E3 ubiquitin-protein ligase TRAF7-like [Apostichopus japonicus]|uniref:E3 ubiquitin-protein ligase TRAF7-like n=1 Tax=Stichopus japonicus TaxID=307972 RepID=UPI003AB27DE9